MTARPEQRDSHLTQVDRAILAEVLEADQQGGIIGRDLARLVGVSSRSIGSRLVSLTKRGFLRGERGQYADSSTTWFITAAGEREVWRS